MSDSAFAIVIFLGGLLTIFCAVKDCDWFMTAHKARFFVKLFGREGARIFYVLLGAVVIVLSIMMAF